MAFGFRAGRHTSMVAPIVLGVEFGALMPGVPLLLGKFVRDIAFVIKNVWRFSEQKVADGFKNAHECTSLSSIDRSNISQANRAGKDRWPTNVLLPRVCASVDDIENGVIVQSLTPPHLAGTIKGGFSVSQQGVIAAFLDGELFGFTRAPDDLKAKGVGPGLCQAAANKNQSQNQK